MSHCLPSHPYGTYIFVLPSHRPVLVGICLPQSWLTQPEPRPIAPPALTYSVSRDADGACCLHWKPSWFIQPEKPALLLARASSSACYSSFIPLTCRSGLSPGAGVRYDPVSGHRSDCEEEHTLTSASMQLWSQTTHMCAPKWHVGLYVASKHGGEYAQLPACKFTCRPRIQCSNVQT